MGQLYVRGSVQAVLVWCHVLCGVICAGPKKEATRNRKNTTGNRKDPSGNRKDPSGNRKDPSGNRKTRNPPFPRASRRPRHPLVGPNPSSPVQPPATHHEHQLGEGPVLKMRGDCQSRCTSPICCKDQEPCQSCQQSCTNPSIQEFRVRVSGESAPNPSIREQVRVSGRVSGESGPNPSIREHQVRVSGESGPNPSIREQ